MTVLFAAGVAELGARLLIPAWYALVGLNATVAAVVSLPLLPLSVLGATPVPSLNQPAADTVGWPVYAAQVQAAFDAVADEAPDAVVVTSNYGEAGAVDRFTDLQVFSGHNALHDQARPPDSTTTVIFVGGQLGSARPLFDSCDPVDRLDNGVDVDNEEQGQPVAVCRDPLEPWTDLWPRLRHLD